MPPSQLLNTEAAQDNQPLLDFAWQLLSQPALLSEPEPKLPKGLRIQNSLTGLLRAGHQIHFVEYQGTEYIFKVFADLGSSSPKRHGFGRRLGFFFDNWLKNPAKRSYQGACQLKALGIPAIQPLAVLHGRWGIHRRGLFIYESVQAELSAKEWLKSELNEDQLQETLAQLCNLTQKLEASDYHFADFKLDNILIEQQASGSFRLVLIDTDEVTTAWSKKLPLPASCKKWFSLWRLRRLKPRAPLDQHFLECHLGDTYQPEDLETWRQIRRFQPNPIKWLKRKNKKLKGSV